MSRTASRFPSSHFEQPNENFGALAADVKFRADKAGKAAGPAQVPAANGGFQAGKGRKQAAPGYENPDAEADCVIHGHVSFYTWIVFFTTAIVDSKSDAKYGVAMYARKCRALIPHDHLSAGDATRTLYRQVNAPCTGLDCM